MTGTENYQVVMSTCPDITTAEKIAGELVNNHLAACVQIISGVKSYFRWQGRLDQASEVLLLIKTRSANYQDIESKIRELHSYELPEIVTVPITGGLRDYLDWIDDNSKV